MVGGIVFGIMADKYGRKRVIILTLLMSGMVSVATFLLRNYTAYVVLRFFLGFFVQVKTLNVSMFSTLKYAYSQALTISLVKKMTLMSKSEYFTLGTLLMEQRAL